MAKLHNELRKTPLGRGLKDVLGVSAQGEGGLERYGETMTPIINVWGSPEFARPRGEQLAGVAASANAIAAEFGYVGVQNPGGAGASALIVIEAAEVHGAPQNFTLQVLTDAEVTAAGVVAQTTVSRDTRWGAVARLRAFTGTHTAVLGLTLERIFGSSSETRSFSTGLPFVLSPGFALAIVCETALTAFLASLGWRDRAKAFSSELGA